MRGIDIIGGIFLGVVMFIIIMIYALLIHPYIAIAIVVLGFLFWLFFIYPYKGHKYERKPSYKRDISLNSLIRETNKELVEDIGRLMDEHDF